MKEKEFVKVENQGDGVTVITTNMPANEVVNKLFLSNKPTQNRVYVDLDLPSGTLWASESEEGYYSFYEAFGQFGDNLPTKEQMDELLNECTWQWSEEKCGYEVIGKNGNSIFLEAKGIRNYRGDLDGVNEFGNYWTSTLWTSPLNGSRCVWLVSFHRYGANIHLSQRICWKSVITVKR